MDFQVVVRITDLNVIAGTARRRQIAEPMTREMLALRWVELTGRE
ncbi:MAG TPA: hypothetical protein VGS13_10745 [Stellaceae bacterium]|nr:hypothetical protein [Stellaceae bacterium]